MANVPYGVTAVPLIIVGLLLLTVPENLALVMLGSALLTLAFIALISLVGMVLYARGGEWGWSVAGPSWIARLIRDQVTVLPFDEITKMTKNVAPRNSSQWVLTGPDGTTFRVMRYNIPQSIQAALEATYLRLNGSESTNR